MKRVLSLLLVVLCAVGFASCALGQGETPHVHTFAETWTSDASGHWYAATCDCADVTETKLSHADKNNDGACDVCEYKMACADGHTYAEEWTIDCTNHWHAADCGHIVAGADVAAHTDGDDDGKCDVCNYVIKDIHIHYYDDAWTYDAESHWHAALCEHGVEVAGKEAHNVNAAGFCTVCDAKVKEVDKASIEEILNAAIANNDKVVSGNIAFDELEYSGAGDAMFLEGSSEEVIYFVLGNGTAYHFWKTFQEGNFYGADENWYELVGEDEVFGISKVFGDYQLVPVAGTLEHLNGYTYHPGSILPSTSVDTSTLADTLAALYALKLDGTRVANATENYNSATGVYTFAFTYHTVNQIEGSDGVQYNVEAFDVEVRFTVDEYYVIDQCDFKVAVYHNIEGLDEDLVYDVENDTYTLTAGANPSVFSYSVSQISGERNFINPFPKESLIPTDFDIYSADVEMREDEDGVAYYHVNYGAPIVDSITATENSPLYIAFKNPIPVTGSFAFIDLADLEITAVNKTEGATGVLFEGSEFNPSYSKDNGYLYIFVKDVGTYTLTIKYLDVVKSFDVVVEEAQSGPVGPIEDNEIAVETTDTYTYSDEYTFVAALGEGKYTFTLPAFLGIQSKASADAYEAPEFDVLGVTVNDPQYGQPVSVVFELEADEEFVFYVGATTKGSWIISYEYEACEVDGGNQGGSGESNYDTVIVVGANTLYFSADEIAADAAEREAVISAAGTYQFQAGNLFIASIVAADGTVITKNADYSFDLEAGEYTVKFSMLSMFGVQADVAYELNVTDVNAEEEEDPTVPSLTLDANTVVISADDAAEGGKMYTFTATVAGTYTFASNDVGVRIFEGNTMLGTGVVTLEAGKTYNAFVLAASEGTFTVTVSVEEDNGGEEEAGTEDNPIVLDTLPSELVFEGVHDVYYAYVVSEDCTIIINKIEGSYVGIAAMDSETIYNDDDTSYYVIYAQAGETIGLNTFAFEDGTTYTYTFEVGEPVISGSFEKPIEIDDYSGSDVTCEYPGGNDAELFVWYLYSAYKDGTLTLTMADRAVVKYGVDADNLTTVANQQTIVIDIVSYVDYYIAVQTSDLAAGIVSFTYESAYKVGSIEAPIVIDDISVDQSCDYAGNGEETYYTFTASADGYVTVSSTFATALLKVGTNEWSLISNNGEGSVQVFVSAGDNVIIGISDNASGEAQEIPFSVILEAGEREPDGSEEAPYEVVLGPNSCEFAGGWTPVYYAYVPGVGGYITVTTTFANAQLQVGTNTSNFASNEVGYDPETDAPILGTSVTVYVPANKVCYIAVSEYDSIPATIPFSVSFEAAESDSIAFLEGTWTGSAVDTWGGDYPYTFTFTADGNGTASVDYGWSQAAFTVDYVFVEGTTVTVAVVDEYDTQTTYVFEYSEANSTLVQNGEYETLTITKAE